MALATHAEGERLQQRRLRQPDGGMPADFFTDTAVEKQQMPPYGGPLPDATPNCVPKCNWHCGTPECNQVCTPVCSPPECRTFCQPVTNFGLCKMKCDPPKCAVVCPSEGCNKATGRCPKCQTVCNPPKCAPSCGDQDSCTSHCGKPTCTWSCKADKCPKPKCEMKCDKKTSCKTDAIDNNAAEMLPVFPGKSVRSEAPAVLDTDILKLAGAGGPAGVKPVMATPYPAKLNDKGVAAYYGSEGEMPPRPAPEQGPRRYISGQATIVPAVGVGGTNLHLDKAGRLGFPKPAPPPPKPQHDVPLARPQEPHAVHQSHSEWPHRPPPPVHQAHPPAKAVRLEHPVPNSMDALKAKFAEEDLQNREKSPFGSEGWWR